MIDVVLPASAWEGVDAGVEALVDQWLAAPGERVRAGQPLARVVLVKANLEVAAPAAGRLQAIRVAAGDTFARGVPIATLEDSP